MRIEEFAKKAKAEVDAFVDDWIENHKKDPEHWPLEAEEAIIWEGLWDFSREEKE